MWKQYSMNVIVNRGTITSVKQNFYWASRTHKKKIYFHSLVTLKCNKAEQPNLLRTKQNLVYLNWGMQMGFTIVHFVPVWHDEGTTGCKTMRRSEALERWLLMTIVRILLVICCVIIKWNDILCFMFLLLPPHQKQETKKIKYLGIIVIDIS